VRITGGRFKGRTLRAAVGHRPTMDQVRLAAFHVLAERVEGARALDLFAGSGAFGLEAFSRGAARVDFVESEPAPFSVLRANLEALAPGEPALRAHREDAPGFLRRQPAAAYDLLLADPPYQVGAQTRNWAAELLTAVDTGDTLAPRGILVLELRAGQPLTQPTRLRPFLDRVYGHARLVMCENPGPP
jgi:16S rRNA (guanine(966)-N(2))-methyltransferase RsmD